MPRYPNYPTTIEGTQRLELTYLRRVGLLEPGQQTKTLHWSSRGEPTGSISLDTYIVPGKVSYLRLHYTVNGEKKYDYRVELEAVPCNLIGVEGKRYYMICPITGRRATVLYLRTGTGVFAHRLAFGHARLYYDSQLENKRFRGLSKYYSLDREWEAEYRKGRKLYYRGKPTRWHQRLLKLEQQTVAPSMLQRMLKDLS